MKLKFLAFCLLLLDNVSSVLSHFKSPSCGSVDSNHATYLASKAAAVAKAAEAAQQSAGWQAAQQVKQQLADRAMQAAKGAEAAFIGKQEIVKQLEKQIHDIEIVINAEQISMNHLQKTVQYISKAIEELKAMSKLIRSAKKLSEGNYPYAKRAVDNTRQQIALKEQLTKCAKNRLADLRQEYHCAKIELDKTKKLVQQAQMSAAAAQKNVRKDRKVIGVN